MSAHRQSRREGTPSPQNITFIQQNVDRCANNLRVIHQILTTSGTLAEIIMAQEPLAGNTRLPKLPGYRKYSPLSSWNSPSEAPRVCTYVHHRLAAKTTLLASPVPGSRDLLLIRVGNVDFLNFYRGVDSNNDTWANFLASRWSPTQRMIIGGDFNAYHPSWSPAGTPAWNKGNEIADWMAQHNLVLSPALVRSHTKGEPSAAAP